MIMTPNLEPIIEFNMNNLEAQAFKIGIIWIFLAKKYFPESYLKGFPKKGDPRKSALFKYCYKLIRETQGNIKFEDYKWYIRAQIDVIKANTSNVMPDASCLVGDKAWMRWKVWQKFHNKAPSIKTSEEKIPESIVKKGLDKTKEFLFGRFEGQPNEENIMMASRDLNRWLAVGKISYFYAILSPWYKKYCQPNFDIELYNKSINDEIRQYFKKIFHYEMGE